MADDSPDTRISSSHWGSFRVRIEGGRIAEATPLADDQEPSELLQSMLDVQHAENRVTQPMVRAGWLEHGPGGDTSGRGAEPFVPVSWEKALDLVANELARVKRDYGNSAIYGGSYGWASAGWFHQANFQLYRFLNGFGGFTAKTDSYSFAAGTVVMPYIVGSQDIVIGRGTSWDALVGTDLIVMFGGMPLRNAQVEYGGLGAHTTRTWMERVRASGTRFVNISPSRADSADFLEAEWVAPRPNTDTALMLGMAHTLLTEGLYDAAFVNRYCVGFDRFAAYLLGDADKTPKDAAWAERISDVPATVIRSLARRMAKGRTMITMTWSLQRADHGEQPYWMAVTLAAMLGQMGLPGGGVNFGYACEAGIGTPRPAVRPPSLPIGDNAAQSSIPVSRVVDMLLHPGKEYDYQGQVHSYPDVRLIYWCGGNPFHHHQDINRLVEAWRRPETIIFHEPWWTSAARYADIVLPATTTLERNDIAGSSRDRYVVAMQRALAPGGEARSDFDIFGNLAGRLGFADQFTEGRDEAAWLRHLYEVFRDRARAIQIHLPEFDSFWENGYSALPVPTRPSVAFADFRADPNGHPLPTPSGRIELFSQTVASFGYDDCPGHAAWIPPAEWLGGPEAKRFPLHLLSIQPRTRLHGQLDNGRVSLSDKINGREPILINPDDAAARGIADGDIVRVYNDRGAVLAGVRVTSDLRPLVVQMATGATYDPSEPGQPGSLDKHGSVNVLTLDKGTSRLAQGPTAQTCLVEIEKFIGDLPDITAFIPPAIQN